MGYGRTISLGHISTRRRRMVHPLWPPVIDNRQHIHDLERAGQYQLS